MPNWCYNHIEVYGWDEDGEDRNRFFSEEEFSNTTPLQKYLPMSEYHQTQEGYNDGGYDWALNTWGTKWPENDLLYIGNDGSLDFSFESPWNPPIDGYTSISKMFPSLYFLHYFREDGMQFSGCIIYHNGSQVFSTEVAEEDYPEWKDEYELDSSSYDEQVEEVIHSSVSKAYKVLKELMHIE